MRDGADLARAVRVVVDSFTTPQGEFIRDEMTRAEYEQLKSALARWDDASPAAHQEVSGNA